MPQLSFLPSWDRKKNKKNKDTIWLCLCMERAMQNGELSFSFICEQLQLLLESSSTRARQVRPLKAAPSLMAEDVLLLPPPAASAAMLSAPCPSPPLTGSVTPLQSFSPLPFLAAVAATCTLCVWVQHFWQGDCGDTAPPPPELSWAPSGVSYSSAAYTAAYAGTQWVSETRSSPGPPAHQYPPHSPPPLQPCFALPHLMHY